MKQLGQKYIKYLFFFITILFIFNGCDNINDSQIPDVPFTINIDLNIRNDLTVPGNSMLFPNYGYGGVIVTCGPSGEYYAYDAACTYEIRQSCKIKNEGITGTCECCGSQFLLIYEAFPTSGPAAAPLRQYQVSRVNSFTLRVYNY